MLDMHNVACMLHTVDVTADCCFALCDCYGIDVVVLCGMRLRKSANDGSSGEEGGENHARAICSFCRLAHAGLALPNEFSW